MSPKTPTLSTAFGSVDIGAAPAEIEVIDNTTPTMTATADATLRLFLKINTFTPFSFNPARRSSCFG
jgi:hypothetical protein